MMVSLADYLGAAMPDLPEDEEMSNNVSLVRAGGRQEEDKVGKIYWLSNEYH
jgi:hypothetical protein